MHDIHFMFNHFKICVNGRNHTALFCVVSAYTKRAGKIGLVDFLGIERSFKVYSLCSKIRMSEINRSRLSLLCQSLLALWNGSTVCDLDKSGEQFASYPLLFDTGGYLCGSKRFASGEEENDSDTAVNNED